MKKSLVVILALVLVFAFSATALAATGTADDPYTSLSDGGLNPTLEVKMKDSFVSGSDYLYDVIGTYELSVKANPPSGYTVAVSAFDVKFNSSPDTPLAPTTANPATANMSLGAYGSSLIYYTINFNITNGGDTTYYSITDHFNVYVENTKLASVVLAPNGSYHADDVNIPASGLALTGHVDKGTTGVVVTAVTAAAGTTVSPITDITFGGSATSATTNIKVTTAHGLSRTYVLTVYRDYDDTSFALTIGGKTLPMYSRTIEYMFPYGSIKDGDSLTFTPLPANADYDARQSKGDIDVDIDKNNKLVVTFEEDPGSSTYRVKITVTALDGVTDEEYTLELEEADPLLLDDLDISIGSKTSSLDYTMLPSKFDDETFNYYVFVPWNNSSSYKNSVKVWLSADYDDDFDDVECTGGTTTSLTGSLKDVGSVTAGSKKTFTITVTDNGNSQVYKVTVYYGEDDADNDASLKDLYVKYGSSYKTDAPLSPTFSKSTYTYTAALPLNTKSAKITLKLSDSDAIIICDGEEVGSTFTASNLKNGANTFKFVVMAEDYDTTKTYTVTLNVGSGGLLSNLVFTPLSGSLNVSPAFSGDVYNYVANVANSVSAIYVTPTAIDSSYTISVYKGASDYKTVVSGKTSSAITLSEGLNEVKVYVYKSGSSKTYTLNIYRQPANTKYQVSNQKVTVNGTAKSLYAVNINGNNFLKLRDLAYMLSGTTKQFNVNYTLSTNTAAITSLTAYVNDPTNPVNQPIVLKNPQLSSQIVTIDGKSAYPIAYNVAGSNYVNLRQVCAMLDIGLTYSASTNSITITTANSYTPGL